MAAPIDLNVAKKQLSEALGDEMKGYLHNLKSWFRQKISKEEFDMEARKLLQSDTVHLHNEFLLAIISKCQTLSSSLGPMQVTSGDGGPVYDILKVPRSPPPIHSQGGSGKLLKKGKLKKKPLAGRTSFQRFVPVNPMTCAVKATYKGAEDTVFASRELSLPDITMIHGRLLVCAWEAGLSNVEDASVKLVMQALETHLKNVVSNILSRRNGYKLREGRLRYSMGTEVSNPYTRYRHLLQDRTTESEATMVSENGHHIPNKRLPHDVNEGYLAQEISTGISEPASRGPITLYNLLDTLQTHKGSISSHSVYAPAIERIIHKLWHPSHEELEQVDQQEVRMKQKLSSAHQAAVR